MKDVKVSDLTVTELRDIVRDIVQEAMVEVLIEFSAMAEAEEQLRYEAEVNDYLRHNMQARSGYNNPSLDD